MLWFYSLRTALSKNCMMYSNEIKHKGKTKAIYSRLLNMLINAQNTEYTAGHNSDVFKEVSSAATSKKSRDC